MRDAAGGSRSDSDSSTSGSFSEGTGVKGPVQTRAGIGTVGASRKQQARDVTMLSTTRKPGHLSREQTKHNQTTATSSNPFKPLTQVPPSLMVMPSSLMKM